MFSLENELKKRVTLLAEKENKIARKEELEKELSLVNEDLEKIDGNEILEEIAEIKRLMGIEEEPVSEEITE